MPAFILTGNAGLAESRVPIAGHAGSFVPILLDRAVPEDAWQLVSDNHRGKIRPISPTTWREIRKAAPADGWTSLEPVRDVHGNILLEGDRIRLLGCWGLTVTITGFVQRGSETLICTEGRTPIHPSCVLRCLKEAQVA